MVPIALPMLYIAIQLNRVQEQLLDVAAKFNAAYIEGDAVRMRSLLSDCDSKAAFEVVQLKLEAQSLFSGARVVAKARFGARAEAAVPGRARTVLVERKLTRLLVVSPTEVLLTDELGSTQLHFDKSGTEWKVRGVEIFGYHDENQLFTWDLPPLQVQKWQRLRAFARQVANLASECSTLDELRSAISEEGKKYNDVVRLR